MKNTMNMTMNMKKYLVVIALLSITISLSAQSFAEMPSSSFGSTSSMMGSGSAYASDPSLNAYGIAEAPLNNPSAAPNRGRMAAPPDDDEEGGQLPIGDAVPFLLLLAGGYAAFAALRRRKAVG